MRNNCELRIGNCEWGKNTGIVNLALFSFVIRHSQFVIAALIVCGLTLSMVALPNAASAARWGFEKLDRMDQVDHLLEQIYHQLAGGDYNRGLKYIAKLEEVLSREFRRADNDSARRLDMTLKQLNEFTWLVEEKLVIERGDWYEIAREVALTLKQLYRNNAETFSRKGYDRETRFSREREEKAALLAERWQMPAGKSHLNQELEQPFKAIIRGIAETTGKVFRHIGRSVDHNLEIRDGEKNREEKRERERQEKLR